MTTPVPIADADIAVPDGRMRGGLPLRLLIVLHDFALGGTERIAIRLANAWSRAGAAVTIFCGSQDGALRTMLDDGVTVVAVRPAIARRRGSVRALARAVRRWLPGARFDAAFVPGNYHWPAVPAIVAAGVPVLVQVSASLDKPQRGPVRQALFDRRMRRLLRDAGVVAALSDIARDQANRTLGRAVARTVPLPALDDDLPPPVPIDAGCTTIVAAGRLVPEKGFADLIDAFARLDRADARLTIVGEGPERASLERRVAALGVADRVMLPGYAPDIRPWLDAARLFVLPSHFEGYPAVIVEALAAGRPVVATDCTPATALLRAKGAGEIVPIRDIAALAVAINSALSITPLPPEALAAFVAHHRIGVVAQAYLTLFRTIAR